MQVRKPWLLVAAALQLGNFAYADDATCPADGTASSIVYEGKEIERLFLIEFLPPWFSNRIKRLIKSPKLHFGDMGLACSLLRCVPGRSVTIYTAGMERHLCARMGT